jgi:predicted PurR-regulated permease PerM
VPKRPSVARRAEMRGEPSAMTFTPSNVVALADVTPVAEEAAPFATKETISFGAQDAQVAAVVTLAILAVIYSLYFGRDLLLPIVMAAVLNLLLQPVMQVLSSHLRMPMPIAALLVIAAVFAAIAGIAYAISSASSGWAQHAPESFAILKQKLAFLAEPITYAQELLHSIENVGAGAGKSVAPAVVAEGNALPGLILFGTAATIREFFTTMLILYFMLATGDRMLRGLIEVLPRFRDKRRAVEIAGEIQSSIASYLMTVTVMNAAVGAVVAASMRLV